MRRFIWAEIWKRWGNELKQSRVKTFQEEGKTSQKGFETESGHAWKRNNQGGYGGWTGVRKKESSGKKKKKISGRL